MPKKRKRKGSKSPAPKSPAPKSAAPAAKRAPRQSARPPPAPRAQAARIAAPLSPWFLYLTVFLAATPGLVGPYGQLGGYTPDLHMAAYIQVFAVFALALLALACLRRSQIEFPRTPVILPLLLFYGWAMLSCLWALGKYQALIDALDWTGALAAALLVMLVVKDMRGLRLVLAAIGASGAVLCLFGVGQYQLGLDWVQQFVVPASTFSNKNMAGQFAILTVPVVLAWFLRAQDRGLIWACALSLAVMCAFVVFTRAKGTWTAFGVELVVLAALLAYLKAKHGCEFMRGRDKKVAAGAAAAVFAILVFVTPSMLGTTEAVEKASIGTGAGDITSNETGVEMVADVLASSFGSAGGRFLMWTNSIPMFRDHFLIGVGLGNWTNYYAIYQSWHAQDGALLANLYHANAHNDYIEILCELGVIGFALFVWLLAGVLRVIARTLAHFSEARGDVLMLGPIVALFGIATSAVFSFPLKQPVSIFLVMVHIALLACHGAIAAGAFRSFSLPATPIKAGVATLLLLAGAALTVLQYNFYTAELHYRQAVVDLQARRFRSAATHAELASEHSPLRETLWWLRASSLMNLGRVAEAEPLFKEVLEVQPYSGNTVTNLAIALQLLGKNEEAAASLEDFLRVQPTNYKWKRKRADILLKLGRYDEALMLLSELRDHYQETLDRQLGLGRRGYRFRPVVEEYDRLIADARAAQAEAANTQQTSSQEEDAGAQSGAQ